MSRSTDARAGRRPRAALGRRLTDRRPAPRARLAPAALVPPLVAALAGGSVAAGPLAAQQPAPAPRPAPRDTAGRAARDSAGARARDSVRAAPSDSAQRDSVIARQLRAAAGANDPLYRRVAPDRLRLTTVGASFGLAAPDQVEAAPLYAVHADYGEIAPRVRVLFGLTYWSSYVRGAALDALARSVGRVVRDPAGDDTVRVARVRSSDVALNADLRWRPALFGRARLPLNVRPWVGAGVGVHLLDVQGAPLTGTFVERALDGVALGAAASLGLDATLLPHVQLTGQARYDLFGGAHFGSVRAGASYVFDRRGRP